VTTAVSGARDMVREGENGFVVSREPGRFAAAMEEALRLDAGAGSVGVAGRYGRAGLRGELVAVWPGISGRARG
jgi:glycosyltransferase involved in cell wall biosynthesis